MLRAVKSLLAFVVAVVLLFVLVVAGTNAYVIGTTKDRIVSENEAAAFAADCIVVLGAAVTPSEEPSGILEDRLDEAISLYHAGAASKIIMSGNQEPGYDEPSVMKEYAVSCGVPSDAIFCDYAGFNTYDTMYRAANVFGAPVTETLVDGVKRVVLDTTSLQYQEAANWVGVLFAVQAIGSVLWAVCIPLFKNRKVVYALSLALGGIGFISTYFIHNQYLLFVSFILIGCAWAAMLALPFTILTNSLSGGHMGTYLGLFNGTICVPQIVAAALGGSILALFTPEGGLPPEINMLVMAGAMLIVGACCVGIIKEKKQEA